MEFHFGKLVLTVKNSHQIIAFSTNENFIGSRFSAIMDYALKIWGISEIDFSFSSILVMQELHTGVMATFI